jgi:hypothetical protein
MEFDRTLAIRIVRKVLTDILRQQSHSHVGLIAFWRGVAMAVCNLGAQYSTKVDQEAQRLFDSNSPTHTAGILCAAVLQELTVNGLVVDLPETFVAPKTFVVTDRGRQWANGDEPYPEDINGYLQAVQKTTPAMDEIALQYLREALSTYSQRTYFASAVMLGACSERLVYLLAEAIENALSDPERKARLHNLINRDRSFLKLLRSIQDNIQFATQKGLDDEGFHAHLSSFIESIRVQRNDAVHPQIGRVPPEALRLSLHAFPSACKRLHDLMSWFNSNKI